MELVIAEDEALQLTNQLSTSCSAMSTLPLLRVISLTALTVVDVIHEHLTKVDSQVSMTFNSWTSIIGNPFFSITGHYIWSPDDRPQQLDGNYTASNLVLTTLRAITVD
jgi:hypothetical protein